MIRKLKLRLLNIVKGRGGNIALSPQAYLIWNKIKLSGNNNQLTVFGNGKFRRCTISVKGDNNLIEIEDGANISFSNLEIVGSNCLIRIGKKTDIGGAYLSAKGESTRLTIGESCMFSRNINVMTYDGHPIYDANTREVLNHPQDICIGNHVWVAANASILKGVTVHDGSIIAFGAIVTKNVEAKTIVAGSPAKTIKSNISWEH
ncbi:acetyltransferase-like isoleucine patch superfamily enzyme [Oceanisphaera litoralis]|uniref:acyltransferase n=1 Tax=Oceanisphaera litoralis TaxID=225144 RepID=UPI00195F1907|nr:acyltransferase [Oceanisphaera litoralis]MBM7456314.1 acetyltransferase-like isoleucine patch superfamily enzyme [Oceanisphaera litoralis]